MDHDKASGSGVAVNIDGSKSATVNVQTTVYNNTPTETHSSDTRTETKQNKSLTNWFRRFFISYWILKCRLQELYSNLTLAKLAWLDEGQSLPMDYFVNLKLNQSNQSIKMTNLFERVESGKPMRILIEGQPGFGKTMLANKLAYDWARNEKYMAHFKLVFFVPLRDLHGRNIEDALEEIREHCGYPKDDIVQIVNAHERDILFILDGLDEVNSNDRREILKILHRKAHRDATVVVTCRTGLYEFGKNERRQVLGRSNVRQDFSDKHVSILGIKSDADKQLFLERFFPTSAVENIIGHLSEQLEILDSPLFLMLLPVLLERDVNIGQLSTKAEFFKKLFNCSIMHSYEKRQKQIEDSFDLFRLNGQFSKIWNIIGAKNTPNRTKVRQW